MSWPIHPRAPAGAHKPPTVIIVVPPPEARTGEPDPIPRTIDTPGDYPWPVFRARGAR